MGEAGSQPLYYYLFDVSRDRYQYEVVIRSSTPIDPFKYKTPSTYGSYDNVTKLEPITPVIISDSSHMWKYGLKYVLATKEDMLATRDRYYELTGQSLSIFSVTVVDIADDSELKTLTTPINVLQVERTHLEECVASIRDQLDAANRDLYRVLEKLAHSHDRLQHWNEPK